MNKDEQAQFIESTMTDLRLNVGQLAEALGVHRDTLGKWKNGKQEMPAVALQAIKMLVFMDERRLLNEWLEGLKKVH